MSIIVAGLLGAAKIACGIIVARTVGNGLNAIGERITPFEKSKAYKQAEHSAAKQKELEMMRESFQERLQKDSIHAQERLAIFNRHSAMLLAEINAHLSLRHALVQDAIRNFPLNISPLVLLENNNIDISFLLGDQKHKDAKPENLENIYEGLGEAKSLNVFITPMHIDARVGNKEIIAAQVFDSVYSSLESVFVNEYSRNSERPVIFYSAAWNKNVKGGLHAADELYYFLKDMPTIVVEPRFDGKTIKLMFSCWGIGYSSHIHSRQELRIPLDLNSMLAVSAYDRSKKALESISVTEIDHKLLKEQRAMYEHNIAIFEGLGLDKRIEKRLNEIAEKGSSTELDELGDYCKLLYINQADVLGIADTISATTGMMIAALSDTHHLLANDVTPRFPYIYKQYFGNFVDTKLLGEFADMYERTYLKLSQEFPEQEYLRLMEKESLMKLLPTTGNKPESEFAVHDSLVQKCSSLGANKIEVQEWAISKLIDFYIENIDDDVQFRKSVIPWMTQEQRVKLNVKLQFSII